jgi:hypothetical protein
MLGRMRDEDEQDIDWNVDVTYFHIFFRLFNIVSILATEFYLLSLSSATPEEQFASICPIFSSNIIIGSLSILFQICCLLGVLFSLDSVNILILF